MIRWAMAAAGLLLLVLASATATHWWSASGDRGPAAPSAIDVGFAQSMLAHHRQAVAMAQLLLDGPDTGLRRLAQQILRSQLVEIGELQGWLKLWGKPLQTLPLRMDWMRLGDAPLRPELQQYLLDCERSPTGMPGLATLAELEQLRRLSGPMADAQFLRLMIAHHEGGIPMARFAAEQAQTPVVQQLARVVVMDQSREINTMRRTLALIEARDTTSHPSGAGGAP